MNYNAFVTYLESGKVVKIDVLNDDSLEITLNNNKIYTVPNPQKEDMKEYFLLNGVEVGTKTEPVQLMLQIAGAGVLAFAVFYYLRKGFSKDAMEIVNVQGNNVSENHDYNFHSIAGNDEAKELVKDVIDFIINPDKYKKLGAKMPKGILLYGPPGTGKTLMAKAIAGEAGVPFYAVSGSDFVQMYVGVGASRIRQLFKKAKKSHKAVIFIDEIDAIGKKRGNGTNQGNDERDQTLNALLTEMSGFHGNQGIVVVAATNRLDTLDEALTRPGRFDRMIEIGLPDVNARRKILQLHLQDKPITDDVDLGKLAKETVYFSGAMLENLANEAAIIAANNNETRIGINHLDTAYYNVIAGTAKKDRSTICQKDREITAYHEGGHALATKLLKPGNTISKVTIIPSSRGYGGFSMSIPEDKMYRTKMEIIGDIKVLLAGRAAEEIIFGRDNITTGASNDIEKASILMKQYLVQFGMDEDFGIFNTDAVQMNNHNELMGKCKNQMSVFYDEVRSVLSENLQILNRIARELIEKETLKDDDIKRLYVKIPA